MKKTIKKILATMILLSVATLTMSSACSRDDDDDSPSTATNNYAHLIVGRWQKIEQVNTYRNGDVKRYPGTDEDVSEYRSDGTVVDLDGRSTNYSIVGDVLTVFFLEFKILELNSTSLVLENLLQEELTRNQGEYAVTESIVKYRRL